MGVGNFNLVAKEIMCHGVCCVGNQNKVGCTYTAMKEKLGKYAERNSSKVNESNLLHASRHIHC